MQLGLADWHHIQVAQWPYWWPFCGTPVGWGRSWVLELLSSATCSIVHMHMQLIHVIMNSVKIIMPMPKGILVPLLLGSNLCRGDSSGSCARQQSAACGLVTRGMARHVSPEVSLAKRQAAL